MQYQLNGRTYWTTRATVVGGVPMQDTYQGRTYRGGPVTDVAVCADYYVFTAIPDDSGSVIAGYVARHPDSGLWRSYARNGEPTGRPEQDQMVLALADVAQTREARRLAQNAATDPRAGRTTMTASAADDFTTADFGPFSLLVNHDDRTARVFSGRHVTDATASRWWPRVCDAMAKLGTVKHLGDYADRDADVIAFAF